MLSGWRSATGARGSWGEGPIALTSRRTDYGLQASLSRREVAGWSRAGLRVEHADMYYRSGSEPSDASDLRTTSPLLTAFVDREHRIRQSLGVQAGASAVLFAGRAYLSPTVRGRWGVSDRVAISGSVSRSHQFAQSLRNAESAVGYVFPVDLFIGAERGLQPVARSGLHRR